MDDTKRKACEGVQAILLSNAVEREMLEAALDACIAEKYEIASDLITMAAETRGLPADAIAPRPSDRAAVN